MTERDGSNLGNRGPKFSCCKSEVIRKKNYLVSAFWANRHVPANENPTPHLAIRISLGSRHQWIPVLVIYAFASDLADPSDSVASQGHDDIIADCDSLQRASATGPSAGFLSLSLEFVTPSCVPSHGDTLVAVPPVPHAGVAILHTVDFPELHGFLISCQHLTVWYMQRQTVYAA